MTTYPIYKLTELDFDKIVKIKQTEFHSPDRPEVENKWRKLKFFLLREGFFRTLSKIKSKANKDTQLKKYLTTLVLESDNKKHYNYSIQSTENQNHFVVKNQFFLQPKTDDKLSDTSIFNQFETGFNSNEIISLPVVESYENAINYKNGVFLYGLGDYSRVYIAPKIQKLNKIFCVDYNHQLADFYKKKFNYKHFGLVPQDSYETLKNTANPLAIIATYHSDHARIANEIFNTNPNTLIFIEKPPCVTIEDIKILQNLYDKGANIEIGYNRRYIPINYWIKKRCFDQQKVINISVKEILINENHWYFWKNQGTRITGNLTHWIDLAIFWINGDPVEINVLSSPSKDETIAVSMLFSEGSLVNITVSDKGNSLRGVQEQIEIRTERETFFIEDYIKFTRVKNDGSKTVERKLKRIKGHDAMYRHLTRVYNNQEQIFYKKEDLVKSALTTHQVSRMYKEKQRNWKM